MKVIFSYSLYGSNPRYVEPMLQMDLIDIKERFNLEAEFYVFCNIDVPFEVVKKLQNHGCEVVVQDFQKEKIGGMFARYQPIFEENDTPVIIRDMDSHLGDAELGWIKEWISSSYDFHIIRDHALHIYPIMGGLFAIRGKAKAIFKSIYFNNESMTASNKYNRDQIFLCEKIYPVLSRSLLVHSRRVVYSQEVYIKIDSAAQGFAGETKINDRKRDLELEQSKLPLNILVLPKWISKYVMKRPLNRVVTFLSLRTSLTRVSWRL